MKKRYYTSERPSMETASFAAADEYARESVRDRMRFWWGTDSQAIVYEQTGRNPPEVLCIWSAIP